MKLFLKIAGWFMGVLVVAIILFLLLIRIPAPEVGSQITPASYKRVKLADNHYRVNNCWLKKNKFGVWEMYLEGNAYERGVIYGVLAKELMEQQEFYFVRQLKEMVPNSFYLNFLKYFVAFFNRNIYKYIPEENLQEIYGVSLSFSDEYNYIGPKYYRILNYHAAHDIGHALNDFQMVGCTSFSVNKNLTDDSTLLIARNFDFTMGDDFAKDKLLVFVKPETGYPYASYSWAGFTGVVSGMNNQGLTVTINASKSDIPFAAKDPVSLLAREILQYSRTIEEAVAIAKKRELFVSESILVGSAVDDRSVIIEKSPSKMDVYAAEGNELVCANHYQGEVFDADPANISNIAGSDSKYRFTRMNELLERNFPLSPRAAAGILRNTAGIADKSIGLGNPKAINQLIAHHSVIFKPAQKRMWVSTAPYQLGEFISYDLNKVFGNDTGYTDYSAVISKDPFLNTAEYADFEKYKTIKQQISKFTLFGIPATLSLPQIDSFIQNNPQSYVTYMVLGDYFRAKEDYSKAVFYYTESLKYEVASTNEINAIKARIAACNKASEK